MERFLSQFPHLKYLTLETDGSLDLFDGNRLQNLIKRLTTFDFQFHRTNLRIKDILISFRTPFWLEEKHWFVACHRTCLFSIPHFAFESIQLPQQSSIYLTCSNEKYFYDCIKNITITETIINPQRRFYSNVRTLELQQWIPTNILACLLDLHRIKSLSIPSLIDFPLESIMPELCTLSIGNDVTIQTIELVKHHSWKQILRLKIGVSQEYRYYIIEELFRVFPRIEQLKYKSPIRSKREMVHLIDGFNHLLHASFYAKSDFVRKEWKFYQNPNETIFYSRRLIQGYFTSRIFHFRNNPLSHRIHWWIREQVKIISIQFSHKSFDF